MDAIEIEIPDDISINNPESYCRFCCSEVDLQSIFPCSDRPRKQIILLLQQLVGITLTVNEDFPCAICQLCLSQLEEFNLFRRRCNAYNDEIRKRRLESAINGELISIVKIEVIEDLDVSDTEATLNILPTEIHSVARLNTVPMETSNRDSTDRLETTFSQEHTAVTKIEPNEDLNVNDSEARLDTLPTETVTPAKTGNSSLQKSASANRKNKQKNAKSAEMDKERDYRCKLCKKFFTDKKSITLHMSAHVDSAKLQCLNCSRTFKNRQGLLIHAVFNYALTSFSCQKCGAQFSSREKLYAHEFYCEIENTQTPTSPQKPEKCDLCPKSFDTKHSLQAHIILHKRDFRCKKCGVDTASPSLLKNHVKRYHSQGSVEIPSAVKCDPCQRTFLDASAYRSHLTKFHQHQSDQIPRMLEKEKLFSCHDCGKRFWSINSIRFHVRIHRKFRYCDQCPVSFATWQELCKHQKNVHPVICDFCPKKVASRKALRSHANKMHGMLHVKLKAGHDRVTYEWRKTQYICACCGQNHKEFRHLEDHFREMHPTEKLRIKCPYCDLKSTSRIGYVGHLNRNCGKTPKKLK